MTVLTASTADQFAMEVPGGGAGVFTTLLVDALVGAAANLLGENTPGSVYAHIDQSLDPSHSDLYSKPMLRLSFRYEKSPLRFLG